MLATSKSKELLIDWRDQLTTAQVRASKSAREKGIKLLRRRFGSTTFYAFESRRVGCPSYFNLHLEYKGAIRELEAELDNRIIWLRIHSDLQQAESLAFELAKEKQKIALPLGEKVEF